PSNDCPDIGRIKARRPTTPHTTRARFQFFTFTPSTPVDPIGSGGSPTSSSLHPGTSGSRGSPWPWVGSLCVVPSTLAMASMTAAEAEELLDGLPLVPAMAGSIPEMKALRDRCLAEGIPVLVGCPPGAGKG